MNLKNLYVLFSILFLSIILIACSNQEGASGDEESGGDENGKVTIKFHTWINDEVGNWDKVIEAFEAEHDGINVDVEPLVENMDANEFYKKLDLLASSGDQMDVFMFSNSIDLAKRVDAGLVAPIDSFLEKNNINMGEEYNSSYYPIDGSYYGLPSKLNTYLVMMNKEKLDEAGLQVPTNWTWDDYKEYAKALTTGQGVDKHYGSYFHTWTDFYHVVKMLSKEENNFILKEDGSSNADDPMLAASLKLRYELEQEDKSSVPLSEALSQKLNYRQQFFSQSVSMVPTASFMVTEWGEFTPEFTIAWAPWPKNEASDEPYSFTTGDIMSVGQNSEHKEEAFTFIRWMTTKGMAIQNLSIPAWTQADLDSTVESLVTNTVKPEAVDNESLIYTLKNAKASKLFVPKGYITEAYDAYNAEAELYLLGEQDLNTSIANTQQKVQKIVEANQQ